LSKKGSSVIIGEWKNATRRERVDMEADALKKKSAKKKKN
jgi:hypothetical protein